ncbi:MAG: rod shape-determining protein MreC [Bacteroidales bacterium]
MRIPPYFFAPLWRFLLFIVLETICVVMISNNGIIQRYLFFEKLRDVQFFFWEKSSSIKNYSKLRTINQELSVQNTILLEEKEKYKEILSQWAGEGFVRNMIDSLEKNESVYDYQWAQIVKNNLNTTHNYIIVDKGYIDGITEDMGVITPIGVVGITRAVGKKHSYVYSFLNSNQQVSAKIGHTNAFGPLTWDQTSLEYATLNEIPQHIDVKQGDTIYTSGYSAFFPPDIPIGIAKDSKVENGTHLSIKVKLLQDFRTLNYVIIIKNNSNREIDSLSNIANTKL